MTKSKLQALQKRSFGVNLSVRQQTRYSSPDRFGRLFWGYWRFLCERLAEEHDIYFPRDGTDAVKKCPVARDWRELFLELYAIKALWERIRCTHSILVSSRIIWYCITLSHSLNAHLAFLYSPQEVATSIYSCVKLLYNSLTCSNEDGAGLSNGFLLEEATWHGPHLLFLQFQEASKRANGENREDCCVQWMKLR